MGTTASTETNNEESGNGGAEPPAKRQRVSATRYEYVGDGEEPHFRLSWGMVEAETAHYSDWTITVTAEDGTKTDSYAVHKPYLAAVSDYFAAMFKADFSENVERCTKFTFPSIVAENFDVFLDYAYDEKFISDDNLSYKKPEEVCTLLFLSEYLQCSFLNRKCAAFVQDWRGGLGQVDSINIYYECCCQLNLPLLREFVLDWSAASLAIGRSYPPTKFEQMKCNLLKKIDTELFHKIYTHKDRKGDNEKWIEVLAYFCQHTGQEVDAATLLQIVQQELGKVQNPSGKTCVLLLKTLQPFLKTSQYMDNSSKALMSRVRNRCIKELYSFIVRKATMADFDKLCFETLDVQTLKSLIRHATTPTNGKVPAGVDNASLADYLKGKILDIKKTIPRSVPLHVSHSLFEVTGMYFWNGTEYVCNDIPHRTLEICLRAHNVWVLRIDGTGFAKNLTDFVPGGLPPFEGWEYEYPPPPGMPPLVFQL